MVSLSILLLAIVWEGHEVPPQRCHQMKSLKYWPRLTKTWNKRDSLGSMKRVFDRFNNVRVNGSAGDDWDVLWNIESPFEQLPDEMRNLKPHQRVNHIPGIVHLINKMVMATSNRFDFIPRAFRFPAMIEDFKKFAHENPEKKFVVKNWDNRGVRIVPKDKVDFTLSSKQFYTEFVENPLLIDGRMFDFGVYVLITSFDPLRIYRFKSEVLARFCPEPYQPFDTKNIGKYVVDESHTHITEMPSLKDLIVKMGFFYKAAIEAHLQSRGFNVEELWMRINDAIVSLILATENKFIETAQDFGKPSDHFFEVVRFDFVINNDLGIHLMEVSKIFADCMLTSFSKGIKG